MPLDSIEAPFLALAVIGYVAAFLFAFAGLRSREHPATASRAPRAILPRVILVATLLAHLGALVARTSHLGDAALADLPTTLLFLTACCTLTGLVVDVREDVRALPLFLAPPVVIALVFGSSIGLQDEPWVPQLDQAAALALRVHIATAFVAYAAFALSALLGLMYLLVVGSLKKKRIDGVARGLPPLERLDRLALGSTGVGVLLLGLSLLVGVLAQRATGALGPSWLTDTKTVFALLTWASYASLAALRHNALLVGRRQAYANVIVFGLVVFTYLGTPLLLGTPHPRG